MDPISIAIGVVGLGMQIFGGIGASETANKEAQVSQDEARQEQGINNLKQQQMELDARRQQTEMIRKQQRAMALATTRATAQGAQFGSGLQGGLAQEADQTLVNLQSVNQNLEIGRGIAGFNQNITNDKLTMASLGGQAATDQGIMSIGGALMKAGPVAGQFAKGFGSGPIGTFSNGGNDGAAPSWA